MGVLDKIATMKSFFVLFLSLGATLAHASNDNKGPLVLGGKPQVIAVTPEQLSQSLPSSVHVHTMTDAKVLITHDQTNVFSIKLDGASETDLSDETKQAKDTEKLSEFLNNVSYKISRDGVLEVKAKASGFYHCNYSMTNEVYESVKGTCLAHIIVNLPINVSISVTYSQ